MIQTRPSLTHHRFHCESIAAEAQISRFAQEGGAEEYHLIVRPTKYASFEEQLAWLSEAYDAALASVGLDRDTSVFRRFFCSDIANQAAGLASSPLSNPDPILDPCAVSLVGEPPAPPAKVALWAYHISDGSSPVYKISAGKSLSLLRGELTHHWSTGLTRPKAEGAYAQTEAILGAYSRYLQPLQMSLKDNLVRTWFFVRDIDANYKGLVDARKAVFARHGLTPDTHFVASTGIEGASSDSSAAVTMDAYSISGLHDNQVHYLSAPDHLSPTYIYGVTFERGVSVSYRDRKHIIISGTASIDSAGNISHVGDVLKQLERTLENVEALLHEAEASLEDACMFIVYVRDRADLEVVERALRSRVGDAPFQTVVAPVCRPGWLVEIECMAIIPASEPDLPQF